MSLEEALGVARDYLEDSYSDEEYTFVMLPEDSAEYRTFWVVAFDTQERIDTGDMMKAPMVRVLVIPKDGSAPRWPPTARPVSDFVAQLEAEQ
ncbi:YrhB domain-containing protein [Streptomyces sp. NPDC049881]|uniref:YrhB domain-containing protein n=1 Tax=Streptomyces sp. NPDC049881 TaxID=3155778 RepID=UPI0034359EBF